MTRSTVAVSKISSTFFWCYNCHPSFSETVGGNFVEIEYGNVVVDGLQNITEKNISLIRTSGLNELRWKRLILYLLFQKCPIICLLETFILSGAMGLRFGAIRITGKTTLDLNSFVKFIANPKYSIKADFYTHWQILCLTCQAAKLFTFKKFNASSRKF